MNGGCDGAAERVKSASGWLRDRRTDVATLDGAGPCCGDVRSDAMACSVCVGDGR